MGILAVLELAGKAAAQDWKRLSTNLFGQLKELKIAKSVSLIIVRIKAVRETVLPTVGIQGTVLDRAYRILPIIAGLHLCAFHNTASGEAEYSGMEVSQSLRQILSKTIAMPHPSVHREQRHMFKVGDKPFPVQEYSENRFVKGCLWLENHLVEFPLFTCDHKLTLA